MCPVDCLHKDAEFGYANFNLNKCTPLTCIRDTPEAKSFNSYQIERHTTNLGIYRTEMSVGILASKNFCSPGASFLSARHQITAGHFEDFSLFIHLDSSPSFNFALQRWRKEYNLLCDHAMRGNALTTCVERCNSPCRELKFGSIALQITNAFRFKTY